MADTGRIDGWKAIGAHFGRDRTTAIRWAQARGLPVRRMPGGKRATVYAMREELDRWIAGQDGLEEAGETDMPPVPPAVAVTGRRRAWIVAAVMLVLLLSALMWWRWGHPPPGPALPADAETARLYLQARDEWARRQPDSLTRAITGLETVIGRDPGFAPAHSALADAYLLAHEFGTLEEVPAFASARAAALEALRIDPRQAGAHRALGFVLYWRDHDPRAAALAFRRAHALSPGDAQTHFWFGNILADNGSRAAAARELNAARLIAPGSVAIQTDLAWALWLAGRDDEALAMLRRLRADHPDFAVVHDCIGTILLARGDHAGYVRAFTEFARARGNRALMAQAEALRAALPHGRDAVLRLIAVQARQTVAASPAADHVWPAFISSLARDRAAMSAILAEAERRGERWGGSGYVDRMTAIWSGDGEIAGRIARRRAPRIA